MLLTYMSVRLCACVALVCAAITSHASAFENALASWCLCAYLVQMRADTSHKRRFESFLCMSTTTYTYADKNMRASMRFDLCTVAVRIQS